jgi:hypothetical protein
MTYVMTDANRSTVTIADAEEAAAAFDNRVYTLMPHGGAGQSIWFAHEDEDDELRVDIDFQADRAALTWLADDSYGVELEPGEPITVMWYVDDPVVVIPAEFVRVSAGTARRAVVEYITTGERPTCVQWAVPTGVDR